MFFAGNAFYVVDGIVITGWLPGVFARFCALLLRFSGFRRGVEAGTIFRVSSSMEFALWTAYSIVSFWGIIPGSAGRIFLR